jgi:hypothetical protein
MVVVAHQKISPLWISQFMPDNFMVSIVSNFEISQTVSGTFAVTEVSLWEISVVHIQPLL